MGRTGSGAAGRVGFDPSTRRRVRRAGARARPLVLPAAVLLAALVASSSGGAPAPAAARPGVPDLPAGLVLVAVQPADPAVLPLAPPGSRVDVYAGAGPLDPVGAGGPGAELVVRDALVVPSGSTVPAGAAAGGLGLPGAAPAVPGSVALAVAPTEAAALASRSGAALLVAVKGRGPDAGTGSG